jgi:N-acetylglucosaminyl-diphospho-decaprenol L-rhamnosyltransferase
VNKPAASQVPSVLYNRDRFHRMDTIHDFPRDVGIDCRISFVTQLAATPVLIVAYRNPNDIVACLMALGHELAIPLIEIFVCENGGPQAYATLVAALTAEDGPCLDCGPELVAGNPLLITRHVFRLKGGTAAPLVHLGEARENLGYAGGVNAWLRPLLAVPGWPAAWILNPDTKPAPDALAELAAYADRWSKGMVGSRLVPAEHPDSVHSRGLVWSKGRAITRSVDLNAPSGLEPDPQEVDRRLDAPAGTSMYVTRACIERIGLMDERYFLFFEDLEWGIRAKTHFGIGYAHRSVVVHTGGTTTGSSNNTWQQSPLSIYLEYRNSILFVRSYFVNWLPWTVMLQFARVVFKAPTYGIGNVLTALRGIAAGVRGQSGRPNDLLQNHRTTEVTEQ